MAYNFKSIADVDVVTEPSETANVLIEEDGVIKKAPKTAVGGGNNVEWDAIFEVIEGSSGHFDSMELVLGDFETLESQIKADILPKVLIKYNDGSAFFGLLNPSSIIIEWKEDDNMWAILFSFLCGYSYRTFYLYEDGTTENN